MSRKKIHLKKHRIKKLSPQAELHALIQTQQDGTSVKTIKTSLRKNQKGHVTSHPKSSRQRVNPFFNLTAIGKKLDLSAVELGALLTQWKWRTAEGTPTLDSIEYGRALASKTREGIPFFLWHQDQVVAFYHATYKTSRKKKIQTRKKVPDTSTHPIFHYTIKRESWVPEAKDKNQANKIRHAIREMFALRRAGQPLDPKSAQIISEQLVHWRLMPMAKALHGSPDVAMPSTQKREDHLMRCVFALVQTHMPEEQFQWALDALMPKSPETIKRVRERLDQARTNTDHPQPTLRPPLEDQMT